MTIVTIYTDFDGTITSRSGNDTVFTPFYQSLLRDYKEGVVVQNYKTSPMKDPDQVQALFEAKFGRFNERFDFSQEGADVLMSVEAIAFFHALLLEKRARINIVTKNRDDYIQALFRYQGFSEEEIAQLNIMFIGSKYNEVNYNLQRRITRSDQIYVLDDNLDDYNAMYLAVRDNDYSAQQIKGYRLPPGQFQWGQYLSDIQGFLGLEEQEPDRPENSEPTEDPMLEAVDEEESINSNSDQQSESETESQGQEKPQPQFRIQSEWQPTTETSIYRTPKIIALFAAIGLTLGLIAGLSLAATGVLVPFGVGVLGIVAVGMIFGGGAACVFSAVGFAIAKSTEPEALRYEDENQNNSYLAMQRVGRTTLSSEQEPKLVEHYPGIIRPKDKLMTSVDSLEPTLSHLNAVRY